MTTTTALDLADCRRARNRYLVALRLKRKSHAIKLLVSGYLPALRDLQVSTDPEVIEAEIETLNARLGKGVHYVSDDPAEQDAADDLFEELVEDFMLLMDCHNMQHEDGSTMHPANYLMHKVELACR